MSRQCKGMRGGDSYKDRLVIRCRKLTNDKSGYCHIHYDQYQEKEEK